MFRRTHLIDERLAEVGTLDLSSRRRLERIGDRLARLAPGAVRKDLRLVGGEPSLFAPRVDAAGGEVELGGGVGCEEVKGNRDQLLPTAWEVGCSRWTVSSLADRHGIASCTFHAPRQAAKTARSCVKLPVRNGSRRDSLPTHHHNVLDRPELGQSLER